jgi:hypothetical protein
MPGSGPGGHVDPIQQEGPQDTELACWGQGLAQQPPNFNHLPMS